VSNPLDIARRFKFYGAELDQLEELQALWDENDPLALLIRCEEQDEEEGLAPGSTLQTFIYYLKITH
jgi:hypothetical protein